MTDDGDDLWANTRPDGEPPLSDSDATPPAGSPAAGDVPPTPPHGVPPVAPPPPGVVPPADPTMIQPTVGGGSGVGPPPPAPPGGGGPFDDDDGGAPPPWLLPVASALVVLLLLALIIVVVRNDGDDDAAPPSTLPATETTLEGIVTTTSGPDTSVPPPTTGEATTLAPSTTVDATTTVAPTTTAAATTTTVSSTTTTTSTTTTVAPDPLPDPGFADIAGEIVPIEAACSVGGGTGFLVTTTDGRVQLDRAASRVDLLFVDTGAQATSTSFVATGSGFVAVMDGPDTDFEIAVNPPSGGVGACTKLVRSSPTSLEDSPRTQGVLDLCSALVVDELVYLAILTQQGDVLVVDFEDGRADIQFVPSAGDARYSGLGTAAGNVYDGLLENPDGATLLFSGDLSIPAPRECDPDEI